MCIANLYPELSFLVVTYISVDGSQPFCQESLPKSNGTSFGLFRVKSFLFWPRFLAKWLRAVHRDISYCQERQLWIEIAREDELWKDAKRFLVVYQVLQPRGLNNC